MQEADSVLVERARAGDGRAFDQLVRKHLRTAHAVAMSVLLNQADAEDVCQDAFITALERIEDCQPDRFAAWLITIVRNRAISMQRHRKVRKSQPLEWAANVHGGPTPAQETERSALRDRLIGAMSALPERQREVLMLHDLEGWRHREIGERLGMKEGTVRYTLFQARRAMRDQLGVEQGQLEE